jgi:hypothetical protein
MEAIVFTDSAAGMLGCQEAGKPFLMTAVGLLASRPPSLPALNPISKLHVNCLQNSRLQIPTLQI